MIVRIIHKYYITTTYLYFTVSNLLQLTSFHC